jgi:hypothetical protein|tara:strand:- start:13322 stop:13867 length:546 start_codon:yes stop_codon:yes gene_type:complete
MGFITLPEGEQKETIYSGIRESEFAVVVGWRMGSGYWLFDLLVEQGIEPENIYLVDAFMGNLLQFSKYPINIVHSDIRELKLRNLTDGEGNQIKNHAFIWEHGPEHVSKEEARDVIEEFKQEATLVSIETPLGPYPQGALYGNSYEVHVSTWYDEDYKEAFPSLEIYKNEEGHIGGIYRCP